MPLCEEIKEDDRIYSTVFEKEHLIEMMLKDDFPRFLTAVSYLTRLRKGGISHHDEEGYQFKIPVDEKYGVLIWTDKWVSNNKAGVLVCYIVDREKNKHHHPAKLSKEVQEHVTPLFNSLVSEIIELYQFSYLEKEPIPNLSLLFG